VQAGPGALVLSRFRRNRQGFIHSGGGGASEWVSEAAGVGLSFTPLWSENIAEVGLQLTSPLPFFLLLLTSAYRAGSATNT